ncbi:MAG: amino acid--tRNA ligase-related protein, partial [Candidatus Magasanikbacteria bacterium]
ILQPIPGGATAKPFQTHFNALNKDVYLRVAPELYLKRLLVGGFNKIFEIGKDFRNEGIDKDHYPEFTMLELYCSYQDYEFLMKKTEEWLKELVRKLNIGKVTIDGEEIDFMTEWPRIKFEDLIRKHAPDKMDKLHTPEIDDVLKDIRPSLQEPVFVIDHPKEISPLAKETEEDSKFVERFQLIAGGTEIVNGFSELNNPLEQKERMQKQEERYREGKEEVSRLDEDYIEALEYGMPPAAGLGIGIERLTSLLTDTKSIKEVIPFTNLREKKEEKSQTKEND